MRRVVLGTSLATGLGLLGLGAAGVLALDRDLQAADRPVAPRLIRQSDSAAPPCHHGARPRGQRPQTRQVAL